MIDLKQVKASDAAMSVPAMLKPHERKLLYFLGSEVANKGGYLIDAGCFTGGSTVALAEGVVSSMTERRAGHILAYDHFLAEPMGIKFIREKYEKDLKPGDNFRSIFDEQLSAYGDMVEVRESNIFEEKWPDSIPIDVLFVDIAKTAKLNAHVMKTFYPALQVGSFLIHQEFFWWLNPMVPVTTLLLKDHFEVFAKAPPSGAFVVTKPVTRESVEAAIDAFYDPSVSLPLMDEAISMAPADNALAQLTCSKARLISELVSEGEARSYLESVEGDFQHLPWFPELVNRVMPALQKSI